MRRVGIWLVSGLAVIVLLLGIIAYAADEPLRAYLERQLNSKVNGYSFRLEHLDFHPFGFSVELKNLVVTQNTDPDPPVAMIPKWHASLEWSALLWGRLVNNQRFEGPVIHVTTNQAKQEAEDDVPVEKRGWQEAVEAVYPFKINEVVIVDGELTYVDEANPSRPIRISNVNLKASNIRNVRSKDREYPSTFQLDGALFDAGQLHLDGQADFLAEPIPGIKAAFHLGRMPLDVLHPLIGRYNVQLRGGTLSAEGEVEYAPKIKLVQLKKLDMDGVHLDYVHAAQTQVQEGKRAKQAYETGTQLTNHEELVLLVDRINLSNCEIGYVNRATHPPYRVFLTHTSMEVDNFSNQLSMGTSSVKLKGRFMASGPVDVKGVFRPDHGAPDFDLAVKIEDVRMEAMNDLWRAYGKFDVTYGLFSFYSELNIKEKKLQGYVKPLFKDVVVYNPEQDRKKGPLRKVYEGLLGDIAVLLENPQRDEVATKTPISGKLEDPRTDLVETILRLIQNAFFKAILPGLEREVGHRR